MLAIIEFLLDWLYSFISKTASVILEPLFKVFFENILGIDNWFTITQNFLDNYVYRGVRFGRQVFQNITGFPNEYINAIVLILEFMFTCWIGLLSVRFLLNAYAIFRTGSSISHVGDSKGGKR